MSSKTVDFCDGICITVDVIDKYSGCAAVVCNDAECFDESRLDLMLERLRQDGISSLIITSYTDRIIITTVGDITPYEAVQIAISVLSFRGVSLIPGRYTADVNRQTLEFLKLSSGTVFYPEVLCVIK